MVFLAALLAGSFATPGLGDGPLPRGPAGAEQDPAHVRIEAQLRPLPDALIPDPDRPNLLPRPKIAELNFDRSAAAEFRPIVNALDRYAVRSVEAFTARKLPPARRLHSVPLFQSFPKSVIEPGLDPERHAQAFELRIQRRPDGIARIEIDYGGEEGHRHAVSTLAQLLFVQAGEVRLPTGRVRDWPSVTWRGVHLFVGPQALEFQERLVERVLVPLRFNHVVLQCERTDWRSTPGIATPMTMSRDDLVRLFALYRRHGIEPIPLIQSFGHMGWLFANGQNLDLAYNRDVPFSLDPRNPAAREKIAEVWREAVRLLKPKVVHFGLDEVDMRGWPENPPLVTELWSLQLKHLGGLAKELRVEPMLWGDKGLAPGEAIDATHGDDPVQASARRKAIPADAIIADWHYRANPESEPFRSSLQLWRREGFKPIASMWHRPENIRGFTLAAIAEGAGTLQTTWAGYESNEANMLREIDQFSAIVLAAEYAWSGRPDMPDRLEFHPLNVLRHFLFDVPEFNRRDGFAVTIAGQSTEEVRLGSVLVRKWGSPIQLRSRVSNLASASPSEVTLDLVGGRPARRFWFALGSVSPTGEGEPVGEIEIQWRLGTEIHRQTKRIFYGRQVRADGDMKPTSLVPSFRGVSLMPVELLGSGELPVPVSISIRASDPQTGIRVHAISAQ